MNATTVANTPAIPAVNQAPRVGCNCAVCQWAARRAERERDLVANYEKYQRGDLVSQDDRD